RPSCRPSLSSSILHLLPPPLHALPSFFSTTRPPPRSTLFPYTTLFRSLIIFAPRWQIVLKANIEHFMFLNMSARKLMIRYFANRSEEHTSELQSRFDLVCRLLLEKKKSTRPRPQARKVESNSCDITDAR